MLHLRLLSFACNEIPPDLLKDGAAVDHVLAATRSFQKDVA